MTGTTKSKAINMAANGLLATAADPELNERLTLFHFKIQLEMLWERAKADALETKPRHRFASTKKAKPKGFQP